MSAKPTIVLVPGAWTTPDCFDIVRQQLKTAGYDSEAIATPSVGAEPPTKGLRDDAAAVRSSVSALAEQGKKVVLVVHSYGGLVAAEASKGLGYQQRAKEGKDGGIIMLVYVAASVLPLGKCIMDLPWGQVAPWLKYRPDNAAYVETPEQIFYHDVKPELMEKAVKSLRHQSPPVFMDRITYEPWHDIECMYFLCEDDRVTLPAMQESMAKLLGDKALVYRCKSSHSPFWSMPEELVKGIEMAAQVGEERAKV